MDDPRPSWQVVLHQDPSTDPWERPNFLEHHPVQA